MARTATIEEPVVWLDAKGAAAYLQITERQFRDKVSRLPDFPQPRTQPGLRLLWVRRELEDWVMKG